MNSQTIWQVFEHGKLWGHCYSKQGAHRILNQMIAAGTSPGDCFVKPHRLPLRVPIIGPLEPV